MTATKTTSEYHRYLAVVSALALAACGAFEPLDPDVGQNKVSEGGQIGDKNGRWDSSQRRTKC
jgi:hypothetical protein